MGWPVCPGAHPSGGLDKIGMPDPGRACSCDRVGCPAPGAHPVSPTWQMQATADSAVIGQWWETRPEANVILATGRVFDVLDVPAVAGATALAKMAADGVETGPVAVQGTERMLFFVVTRGAPDDEDEWWSCGLDASPDPTDADRGGALALPGQLRARPAVQVRHGPGRTLGARARGQVASRRAAAA